MTRTPEAAHSMARLFVKLSTAALAAPVWLRQRGNVSFQRTGSTRVSCEVMCGILTSSLGSPSTCQRWCSRSRHHVFSSMQSRLGVRNRNQSASLTQTLTQIWQPASHPPGSSGRFRSGWCLSQLSSLLRRCALLGCWTALHHYSPGSLSFRTALTLSTQVPSPATKRGIRC